jgi:hypothetical protein
MNLREKRCNTGWTKKISWKHLGHYWWFESVFGTIRIQKEVMEANGKHQLNFKHQPIYPIPFWN